MTKHTHHVRSQDLCDLDFAKELVEQAAYLRCSDKPWPTQDHGELLSDARRIIEDVRRRKVVRLIKTNGEGEQYYEYVPSDDYDPRN